MKCGHDCSDFVFFVQVPENGRTFEKKSLRFFSEILYSSFTGGMRLKKKYRAKIFFWPAREWRGKYIV
tara:strand:+ start:1954 stop:2157 length:204 start_codon:yes stop_codon:yes gene_type:complete